MALVQSHQQPVELLSLEPELENYPFEEVLHAWHAPAPVEKIIPASALQERIVKNEVQQWIKATVILLGEQHLQRDNIQRIWQELCSHHACLRTVIRVDNKTGNVSNHISSRVSDVRWGTEHLTPVPSGQELSPMDPFAKDDLELPYLAVYPSPAHGRDRSHCQVVLHIRKALMDATSLCIVARNFALLYFGLPLPEHTPFSCYLTYGAIQGAKPEGFDFWTTTLDGFTTKSFSNRQVREQGPKASVCVDFAKSTVAGISQLESTYNVERKRFFEALWALTLSRHSGQSDIVFAATGRDTSFLGVETCVGLVNQLFPVRIAVHQSEPFLNIVRGLGKYHTSASAHIHTGYAAIDKLLASGRVESCITYAPGMRNPTLAGTLSCFPMSLFVTGTSSIRATIYLSPNISKDYAALLLQHFIQAVDHVACKPVSPETLTCNIDMGSYEEREFIKGIARQGVRQIKPSTIVQLFEDAAARYAERPAVRYEYDEPLSFETLNATSNRLARTLNLSPGSVVPVCMDRTVNLIVSLLALLKLGATYVILDPEYPQARVAAIVDQCGASVVLTESKYLHRFSCTAWAIQDLAKDMEDKDSTNLGRHIRPDQTAYIVFTSGSTGKPKGVMLTHAAATSGMACHDTHGLSGWLLFYNPAFSAAQRTMLSTLVHGSTLLLASKEQLTRNLPRLIRDMNVDALGITPSALLAMPRENIPSVKRIVLVGERIPQAVVDAWADKVSLFNSYGLSECTQLNFSRQLDVGSNPRIIGRPADTTAAYVIFPGTDELAPLGIAGELCLAGPQLAKGYLGMPLETDRALVPNPFGEGKMYRTGDAARTHADGSIEIIGRLDFQTKIGGQKVDPSEVDQVISSHPAIDQCAVTPVNLNDDKDYNTLVAAVVLNRSWTDSWDHFVQSIQAHTASSLPSYMVPSFWLQVEVLPANTNGKVDLRQIQKQAQDLGVAGLVRGSAPSDDVRDTPSTPIELAVMHSWADGIEMPELTIKRHHTFLSLGGSSLQALRTMSALQRRGLVADLGQLLDPTLSLKHAALAYKTADQRSDDSPQPFSLIKNSDIARQLQSDATVVDAYPATPLQESLLASLEAGEEDVYTYRRVWDVSHLDVHKLRGSFEAVYRHSEIIRTSFMATPGGYLQVVHTGRSVPWVESGLQLSEFLEQDRQAVFDVSGPMLRITLVEEKFLVVAMHHSLFDFWSHDFIYQDVTAAYLGLSHPDRPPFRHFVRYLTSYTADREHDKFWRTYLEGVQSAALPIRPVVATVTMTRKIPAMNKKIMNARLTSGCVLYCAWAILLWQRTGSTDSVFATTLAGREVPVPAVDIMDGPTLTTVPQRILIDPRETVSDLLRRVASQLYELIRHSQTGMRKALSLGQLRGSDVDTLVNVLVKAPRPAEAERIFRRHGTRSIWESSRTTMEIEIDEGDLDLHFSGKTDRQQASFLLDAYALLIESIVLRPDQLVSELDNMGAAERHLLENNLSHRDKLHIPEPQLLHAEFERLAESEPGAIAVDWNGELQVTYGALNGRANSVAAHLVRLGTQVGEKIPLVLDKSPDMLSIILGVMKAGAAYVPLSPSNSVERNDFIIRDVEAKRVIVAAAHATSIPVASHNLIVAEDIVYSNCDPRVSVDGPSPTNLAYVIYTSGSTGTPKGVQVPHRSAAAAVESMSAVEGRYHGEWRTLQFANYVFDASVQDFFNTLSTGGTLCMAPTDELQSDLAGAINRMRARQAILTPTIGKLLRPEDVPTMKKLILGGEPLPRDVIERWLPHCEVLNVYGPTETSMVVTTKNVTSEDHPGNIGSPFPTVSAFIIEPDGERLVPCHSIGELCLSGPQVTDGYVGRPDLTAKAFTQNTALNINCLYRTGDLARWLPNGDIECLGRKDNQVKIHGHRIELEEIEQAIIKSCVVQDGSAVVVPVTVNSQTCLAAFCVFEASLSSPTIQSPAKYSGITKKLHSRLGTLAGYMVPKYVFPLNGLPKLPSQKTDRKALKRWVECMDRTTVAEFSLKQHTAANEDASPFVPVETEEEAALEKMWSSIFDIPEGARVGRHANFTSLGGDSIAAIRLAGVARRQGYALSVQSILKSHHLQAMASLMKQTKTQTAMTAQSEFTAPLVVLDKARDAGLDMEKDVEYGQSEFLAQGDREEQIWHLMALRHMEAMSPEEWLEATKTLTKVNDILRTSWSRDGCHTWVGLVLKSSNLNVEYHECRDELERKAFLNRFWETRFQFGAPFIKYAVLTNPKSNGWDLAIKMNHAVYDGTLFRILDDQWTAIRSGQPLPQHGEFKEFAFHAHSTDKSSSLAYWKETMNGKSLTMSHIKKSPITDAIARRVIDLKLEATARACGVTPAIIFQAAYQLWLAKDDGSDSLTMSFDYLISGRNIEAMLDPQTINGTLANFLPIRCQVSRDMSVKEYFATTQDTFWKATEHGDVGLAEIYEAANLDLTTHGNKTLFLYQPFEPIPPGTTTQDVENTRWLPMSKANYVRLLQPYEMVIEVAKTIESHRLAIYYDSHVHSAGFIEKVAQELTSIVSLLSVRYDGASLSDIFHGLD